MKIKWKIVLSLSLLMITIVASIDIIVGFKVSHLITVKTSKELVNYSELGITLLDTNYPGDWRLDGDKLYKGDTLINGNYDVVDKLSKDTGLLSTIFAGDTRISTTVTDPNSNRIISTKASAEIVTKVLHNGQSFKGITQVEGKDTEAYYVPLRDKDNNIVGMLFVGIYNSSLKKNVSDTMKDISMLLLIIAFIGFIISYFLGSYMSKGYRVLEKDMAMVADGDFNIRFHDESLKRKDEIGDIVRSFYHMQNKIKEIITSIQTETDHINTSSALLADGADQVYHHVKNIAATTEELSAGMEETAASTEEMSAASQSIEEEIAHVANKAVNGQVIASEIKARAEGLKKIALDSQKTANEIYQDTNQKLRQSIQKASAINEIKSLSKTILNITAQTNLLALNASIESARAGEAGKGFAVVAGEIANLAQNSKAAVSQIEAISNDISTSVEEIVTASTQLLTFMDTRVIKDYKILVETGEQYNSDANTVDEMVSELTKSAEQLKASISYIRRAVDEVTTASQEGAKASSDIADKSTSIFQETDQVHAQSSRNKEIAAKLIQLVQFFKIAPNE